MSKILVLSDQQRVNLENTLKRTLNEGHNQGFLGVKDGQVVINDWVPLRIREEWQTFLEVCKIVGREEKAAVVVNHGLLIQDTDRRCLGVFNSVREAAEEVNKQPIGGSGFLTVCEV